METKKQRRQDILEEITQINKCQYISDIKIVDKKYIFEKIDKEIDISWYTPDQWEDAISYITDKKVSFENLQQIKDYISTFLKKI